MLVGLSYIDLEQIKKGNNVKQLFYVCPECESLIPESQESECLVCLRRKQNELLINATRKEMEKRRCPQCGDEIVRAPKVMMPKEPNDNLNDPFVACADFAHWTGKLSQAKIIEKPTLEIDEEDSK